MDVSNTFNTVGINDNILRRGRKAKKNRPDGHSGQAAGAMGRIHQRHPNYCTIIRSCEERSQERRRPSLRVSKGSGILSTRGAQINLKEYPSAAQLKKVTVLRSTPASVSQTERVKKIKE